ncbi:MAG: hypothetical protein KJZ65_09010 [Phycisphaerales bacterium]|nr:hypothetical protein [Phycisphaerales bacterium]
MLLAVLGATALAQEVGSREWFEQARRTAATISVPPDTYFEVTYRRYANGDEQLLAKLAAAIADKPEHPLRPEYNELARRLSRGPDVERERVWYFDANRWRISTELDWPFHPRVPWRDAGMDSESPWRLIPDTVTILDANNPSFGYDPAFDKQSAIIAWRFLVTQNIAAGAHWQVGSIERNGDEWTAVLINPEGTRHETYRGTLDQQGRLFIYESVMNRSEDDPKWLGTVTRFTRDEANIMPDLIAGLAPAIALRRESPIGALAPEEWEITKVSRASLEGSPDLVAIPRPGTTDPIRDLSALTGVLDRRNRTAYPVADGVIDRAGAVPIESRQQRRSTFDQWATPVVAVAMVLVVGVLLVLKWKVSNYH